VRILFLIRSAPYGTSRGLEALDAVFAASVFEQDISLLYLDDGVFHLLADQDGAIIGQKNASAPINALPLHDVEHVYGAAGSLAERGLEDSHLIPGIFILKDSEIKALIKKNDVVLSF